MATIYSRLTKFYLLNYTPLTAEKKSELGKIIASTYHAKFKELGCLNRIESIEDTGTYHAISYPKKFNRTIDEMIKEFLPPPPQKKERKRIPLKLNK
jgi:hypothetical protein